MKVSKKVEPVKLVVGLICGIESLIDEVSKLLSERFGEIDYVSKMFDFKHTDYYKAELGDVLKRRFISFVPLIDPEELKNIKLLTNSIEERFSIAGKRRINIDPGYVSQSKVVMASTKDHRHRIYLGQGTYGEVTLYYSRKDRSFCSWEWTYPDYKELYIETFNHIRKLLRSQLCMSSSQICLHQK